MTPDALLSALTALARRVASRTRYPEPLDLIGVGWIGWASAIERFDPTLGVPLAAFASRRAYGAMFDYVKAEGRGLGRLHTDPSAPHPAGLIDVLDAIGRIPAPDRSLLEDLVRRGQTEAGKAARLSKSWTSRRLDQARARLAEELAS